MAQLEGLVPAVVGALPKVQGMDLLGLGVGDQHGGHWGTGGMEVLGAPGSR